MRTGQFLNRGNILRALLVVALYAAHALMQAHDAETQQEPEQPALCDTDSDCLELCPPPADEPECDGGPQ
jgi:hypothetical protein